MIKKYLGCKMKIKTKIGDWYGDNDIEINLPHSSDVSYYRPNNAVVIKSENVTPLLQSGLESNNIHIIL